MSPARDSTVTKVHVDSIAKYGNRKDMPVITASIHGAIAMSLTYKMEKHGYLVTVNLITVLMKNIGYDSNIHIYL